MLIFDRVTKLHGDKAAVDHLSLHIKPGEFFGLLGPNGAGKTTTLRLLTALTPPTAGQITVNGQPVSRNNTAAKRQIGLVPQHINLEPELTVEENLRLHGLLYNMSRQEINRRIDRLLAFSDLAAERKALAGNLSGGMKRKVMIARALMHQPALLLLDEPTAGLDVFSRRRVWDLIKSLNARGMTILLTTHYLEEAEHLCSRIGLLKKGRLIMTGSVEELRQQVGPVVVEVFAGHQTDLYFFRDQGSALDFAAGLTNEFTIRQASLEDVFVKMTGERVESQ
ncbi:ABC transporter ATP-binding protein [Desulforamulus hydrothermalis]|uniref:Nod factor export ATP-binding protein I n=1 Tax=Desulforamulus hydrothermalis Lam5 = DSM 18033 TaxID=1121428 RepID=K8DYP6_9FIRM|nr:ABC transporter ATP-binding protein [Desulforamulus hydrothermalis]CCO07999.1 Nod factor export ATP-binding protein I [Desulforamulus hydrothermalis Lam5 = DSM 18033]SHG84479.1 ABC-2 type transport system ATP-binding protein [Desulforamulus hydrothermalis Lam5 = DSM 18033]